MSSRDSIKVVCRIRPENAIEQGGGYKRCVEHNKYDISVCVSTNYPNAPILTFLRFFWIVWANFSSQWYEGYPQVLFWSSVRDGGHVSRCFLRSSRADGRRSSQWLQWHHLLLWADGLRKVVYHGGRKFVRPRYKGTYSPHVRVHFPESRRGWPGHRVQHQVQLPRNLHGKDLWFAWR